MGLETPTAVVVRRERTPQCRCSLGVGFCREDRLRRAERKQTSLTSAKEVPLPAPKKSTLRAGEISYTDEIQPDEIAAAKGGFYFIVCRGSRFHSCRARISSRLRRDITLVELLAFPTASILSIYAGKIHASRGRNQLC